MPNVLYGLNGVGAGKLINDQHGCRDAVFAAEAGVALAGKLRARDVLHPQDRAVRQRADDHVVEFDAFRQAALDVDGVLELRARFGGRLSDLSGGRHKVLFVDDVGEIGSGQPEFRQLVGANPEAHGVVALADDHRGADAGGTRDGVHEIDRGEVGKERLVEGAVRRIDRDRQQDIRGFLLHRNARVRRLPSEAWQWPC